MWFTLGGCGGFCDCLTQETIFKSLQSIDRLLYSFVYCYHLHMCVSGVAGIYRVSQEECARLRESVPYVKLYRYNPKHLYPKLNGYGDSGQRSLKL